MDLTNSLGSAPSASHDRCRPIPISRPISSLGNWTDLVWFIAYCVILAEDCALSDKVLYVRGGSVLVPLKSLGP